MPSAVVNSFQPAMTEWFAAIGDKEEAEVFRAEDNAKAERLEKLYQLIGLPYERPMVFPARELRDRSSPFAEHLREHGKELCAIRLVPTRPDLPKIRQRGLALNETYEQWFLKQTIDHELYDAYIFPHSETLLWSGIVVVKPEAIFGEIVRGLHAQLTQGEMRERPVQFCAQEGVWQWSHDEAEAQEHVRRMLAMIAVEDSEQQSRLREDLGATFAGSHLCGYFEITVWPDGNMYFIDYNRILPNHLATPIIKDRTEDESTAIIVRGVCAHPGTAQGRVVVVDSQDLPDVVFEQGDILVTDNTDIRFVPLMKKAGAIVTNRGGLLSHAAIVCREFNVPCIVGARGATSALTSGTIIAVNAGEGTVTPVV